MFPGQVYRPQCRAMGPRQIVQGCIELCILKCSIFPGRGMVFGYRKVEHLEHMKKHHPYHAGNWKPLSFGGRYANKVRLKFHRCSRKIYLYTNKSKMSSWFWFLFTHTVATEAPTTFWQCLSWHFGNRAYATVVYRGNGEIPSPQEMASQRHSPRMMRRDQTPKDF
jgi:hypothetical protein